MNSPYIIISVFCLLVILSYVFTLVSKFIRVPSVILLIGTGVLIQFLGTFLGFSLPNLNAPLKLLGIVGLVMIVLEGALDLEIHRSKWKTILLACLSSIFNLGITNILICEIIFLYQGDISYFDAFLSAIPLSVVSSAIVIPSVNKLQKSKKEFMVLESTLSDIFGIMLFVFWILETGPQESYIKVVSSNIVFSLIVSFVLAYLMVYIFQKIKTEVKLFLLLSIIALIYSIGEYFHYSALIMVLIFGIVLNNTHVFFRGKLNKLIDGRALESIKKEFIIITLESSFLIRTFFFVVFGFTLNLEGLFDFNAIIVAISIMVIIFIVRAINLKLFFKSNVFPEMVIAPRGLVTILLFQKVLEYTGGIPPFGENVLALVIIGTNLMMMLGLVISGNSSTAYINRVSLTHPGFKTSTMSKSSRELVKKQLNKSNKHEVR